MRKDEVVGSNSFIKLVQKTDNSFTTSSFSLHLQNLRGLPHKPTHTFCFVFMLSFSVSLFCCLLFFSQAQKGGKIIYIKNNWINSLPWPLTQWERGRILNKRCTIRNKNHKTDSLSVCKSLPRLKNRTLKHELIHEKEEKTSMALEIVPTILQKHPVLNFFFFSWGVIKE